MDRPDYAGRLQILGVHARGKTLAKDVDLDKVARRTPGYTGADLANLLNEAAILAARRELTEVSNDEISDAIERIMVGPEKKDRVMSERRKRLVAYHEAGHAIVGALMPDYDPVQKISIIPRGNAGGLTFFTPSEERMESGLYSRAYLQNQMAVALGGRVAEEIIYGEDEVTTGASNDLQQVASTARQMITRFGMSDTLGPVALGRAQGGCFWVAISLPSVTSPKTPRPPSTRKSPNWSTLPTSAPPKFWKTTAPSSMSLPTCSLNVRRWMQRSSRSF